MKLVTKISIAISFVAIVLWLYGINEAIKEQDNRFVLIQVFCLLLFLYTMSIIYEDYIF